jgi:hypothetical protein
VERDAANRQSGVANERERAHETSARASAELNAALGVSVRATHRAAAASSSKQVSERRYVTEPRYGVGTT